MSKIALINQRYGQDIIGGSEYYTRILAERLKEKHDVEVITTCAIDYLTWENYYAPGLDCVNDVPVRRFLTSPTRPSNFADESERLMSNLRAFTPDLAEYLYSNGNKYDFFIPVTYCFYPSVRVLNTFFAKSVFVPTAHDEPEAYDPVYRYVFRGDERYRPAFIMFLTDEERQFVHKFFRNTYIPYDVAGVGIDLPKDINGDRFRTKYGIYDDYCLYIGRIDPMGKGCDAMFKYFIEYKKRNNSNLKLVLMGKSIMDIPKHKDIIHLGFVSEDDKFDGISAAKALWLNSIAESLSIVVLEALALGVPVIVNEYSEVLRGHCIKSNAGLYYKGFFEFESVLNYLLENEKIYGIMSKNGKDYVREFYNWDVTMDKFEKAFSYLDKINN